VLRELRGTMCWSQPMVTWNPRLAPSVEPGMVPEVAEMDIRRVACQRDGTARVPTWWQRLPSHPRAAEPAARLNRLEHHLSR
jgi:hypothetical protein